MICQLCLILINLIVNNPEEDSKKKFIHEIVADGRSFKIQVYQEAADKFGVFSLQETGIELKGGVARGVRVVFCPQSAYAIDFNCVLVLYPGNLKCP